MATKIPKEFIGGVAAVVLIGAVIWVYEDQKYPNSTIKAWVKAKGGYPRKINASVTDKGEALIHLAAKEGRVDVLTWLKQRGASVTSWRLEIVKRSELHTFKVLAKRWIVERTFGWLMFWRILNRHHERKHDTAENIMRIAMIRNMLRFLTRKDQPAKNKKAA